MSEYHAPASCAAARGTAAAAINITTATTDRAAGLRIGWDVGGAHLKAALLRSGQLVDVAQWPCPLWQGQDRLSAALAQAHARWPGALAQARHGVTMTAEMVDLFPDRASGVAALAGQMALELTGLADPPLQRLAFYAGALPQPPAPVGGASAGLTRPESGRWLSRADAVLHWPQLASANYLASASLAAAVLGEGLLVDIGSTTSDLIVLRDGAVHSLGQGDAGRLASGELVYQGVVRTPLIALAQRVPFGAQTVHVMNELFATSADVYRLTGELAAAHDQQPPADGGAKTEAATCQRLARLLGRDAVDASPEQWRALAQHWRSLQLAELAQGLQSVIQAAGLGDAAPLVAAGCGAFLVADLARDLGRAALSFSVDVLGLAHGDPLAEWAQVCAPAVAVAILLPAAS